VPIAIRKTCAEKLTVRVCTSSRKPKTKGTKSAKVKKKKVKTPEVAFRCIFSKVKKKKVEKSFLDD
jgi:hypothetical protein